MDSYVGSDMDNWIRFACAVLASKGGYREEEMLKAACHVADKMVLEVNKRRDS